MQQKSSFFNLEISKCLLDAGFKNVYFYICCPTLKEICLLVNVLLTTNNELTSQLTSRTKDQMDNCLSIELTD
jgi:hypothetical protein